MPFLNEPVALVGLACRFPGAPDPRSFWTLLSEGNEALGAPSDERLAELQECSATARLQTPPASGFLPHTERFDCASFGCTRAEAARMDPRQRLALELAWEALEDGGYNVFSQTAARAGVYIGVVSRTSRSGVNPIGLAHDILAADPSAIAGNLASFFDLSGPAITVETATSSSLVAIHVACQAIRCGDIDIALAGGMNIFHNSDEWAALDALGTLSVEPHIRPFDENARGYVRAEGGGLLLLKPLSQALTDKDRIYCTVLSTEMNHNGRSRSLVAPKATAQLELLRRAYKTQHAPDNLAYLEAHGSGTRSGDDAEWNAIADFTAGRAEPLQIGSVKANIGHLEPAAGVAGLIKVALSAYFGRIPASINTSRPRFHDATVQVQTRSREWPAKAVAGVTSLGMTGSNCHLVISPAPPLHRSGEPIPPPPYFFRISANTASALRQLAHATAELCSQYQDSDLYDMCYSAAMRRSVLPVKAVFTVSSVQDMRSQLLAFSGRANDTADLRKPDLNAFFTVPGVFIPLPAYPWERQALRTQAMDDVIGQLRRITSEVLELAPEAFDPDTPFVQLGLDSLRALDLENRLIGDLGLEIPASDLLSTVTLNYLTGALENRRPMYTAASV